MLNTNQQIKMKGNSQDINICKMYFCMVQKVFPFPSKHIEIEGAKGLIQSVYYNI